MTPEQALACLEQERLNDMRAEGFSEADCDMVPAYVLARAYRTLLAPSATTRGWCIRHADKRRWRTMDTMGMPDWTEDPAKALCCRLREHVEAYAADDPDDVCIVEVPW